MAPRDPARGSEPQTALLSPQLRPCPAPHLPGRWLVASALDFDPLALQPASLLPPVKACWVPTPVVSGVWGSCSRCGASGLTPGWGHPRPPPPTLRYGFSNEGLDEGWSKRGAKLQTSLKAEDW